MFPEGTRSYSSTPVLLPFKKGAFHLAVDAQVPIVPVVAANYADILSVRERRFRSGTVRVKILPPVKTEGLKPEDVEALVERVRVDMGRVLGEISPNGERGVGVAAPAGRAGLRSAGKASGVDLGR